MSNGSVDNPGGVGGAASLPFGMTAIDPVFNHPTAYMWSAGVQREMPFGFVVDATYVGRRGRLPAARARHQPAAAGHLQANPGVNTDCLRPYKGYGVIRLSENAGYSNYNACRSARTAATRTGSSSAWPTRSSHSEDNASGKRDVLFNAFDDSGYWGNSSFDRRHVFNFYYIYDLPFFSQQNSIVSRVLGGWQISGATFMRTGTPLWVTETTDIAGVGDAFAQPYNQVGDPTGGREPAVLGGRAADQNFWFNPRAFTRAGGRHLRQRAAVRHLQPRAVSVGHRVVQERRR